jgi:hypothetical protein
LCHSLAEEREVREVPIMGVLFSGLLELRNLEFCPCFEGNPIEIPYRLLFKRRAEF